MSEIDKIKPSHLSRVALVYIRQSTAAQVEHNRESTLRQYALAQRAATLGWPQARITIIDDDLGLSGSSAHGRGGFARMAADVALGHVGLILGLEVSRLARNNADWYRLLDLCSMTDTLIGDADGLYHPTLFNDRLLLGLKGTMSEAELHVLRAAVGRGHSQQGRARRVAPWAARGLRLGRCRRRGAAAPGRSGERCVARGLRALRGVRLGTSGLAVVSRRGSELSDAAPPPRPDRLDSADLHCHSQGAEQPRLCWRVHLWQDSTRALRRRARQHPAAQPPLAARAVVGAHQGAPHGLHRLVDLRGQPGAARLKCAAPGLIRAEAQ